MGGWGFLGSAWSEASCHQEVKSWVEVGCSRGSVASAFRFGLRPAGNAEIADFRTLDSAARCLATREAPRGRSLRVLLEAVSCAHRPRGRGWRRSLRRPIASLLTSEMRWASHRAETAWGGAREKRLFGRRHLIWARKGERGALGGLGANWWWRGSSQKRDLGRFLRASHGGARICRLDLLVFSRSPPPLPLGLLQLPESFSQTEWVVGLQSWGLRTWDQERQKSCFWAPRGQSRTSGRVLGASNTFCLN